MLKKRMAAEAVINDAIDELESDDFISEPEFNPERDPLLHSLNTLTPDDIAPEKKKEAPSPREIALEVIRKVILIGCVAAFIGSIGYILYTVSQYKAAEDFYSGMQDDFFNMDEIGSFDYTPSDEISLSPHSTRADLSLSMTAVLAGEAQEDSTENGITTAPGGESHSNRLDQTRAKINYYRRQNEEVIGFILVPNTKISYLICQTDDNDYYLNHTYTGDFIPAGSIFADFRCLNPVMRNYNYILYGHNMNNGMMFHDVTLFLDEEFFKNNKDIYLYTLDGIYYYEIFAVHKASMYDDYIRTDFYNGGEFAEFANSLQDRSMYIRGDGYTFNEYDRILTLSTCTNGRADERYALQAKLVYAETD